MRIIDTNRKCINCCFYFEADEINDSTCRVDTLFKHVKPFQPACKAFGDINDKQNIEDIY